MGHQVDASLNLGRRNKPFTFIQKDFLQQKRKAVGLEEQRIYQPLVDPYSRHQKQHHHRQSHLLLDACTQKIEKKREFRNLDKWKFKMVIKAANTYHG
jgi:hypothetical protein